MVSEDIMPSEQPAAIDMDRPRVFRCLKCKEYINTKMTECRFCGTSINYDTAYIAAEKQDDDNRLYRKRHYVRHIWLGLVIFQIGLTLTLVTIHIGGGGFILFYGAIGGGLLDFLYGLFGWLEERKKQQA